MPRPLASDPTIRLPGCVEQPLRFGPGKRLFGVLCRPDTGPMPEFAVVIGNTGGDPQHGIGRFGVALSRRLARQGIAALRLDFAGLGDSVQDGDDDAVHVFETDRAADLAAVLDSLSRLGVRRFGTTGICSGAYHALHAAVADRRIAAAALVNLVTFSWIAGDTEDPVLRNNSRSTRFYLENLRRADTWRRLLHGQVRVGGIVRTLAGRVGRRVAVTGLRLGARLAPQRFASGPQAMMRGLSARGARLLMMVGFDDPSLDVLEEQFGPGGKRLDLPGITVRIDRELDHNLLTPPIREHAAGVLAAFFGEAAALGAPVTAPATAPATVSAVVPAHHGAELRAA